MAALLDRTLSQLSANMGPKPDLTSLPHASSIFPWVSTLLRRSGSRSIDVLIDLEFEESEDEDQSNIPWRPAHAVLLSRIFAANTHRLRTFEISSNIWQLIEGLASSLIDVPMPLLQSWTVMREKAQWGREFSSDLQSDAVTRAIECAPGATPSAELSDKMYPNLRVLTLQGTYQRWAQLIPRHLVELNLKHLPRNRRPTFNQLKVFLLGNQSTLESLTVWAADPLRLRADQSNITLPKLKTLSLGFDPKSHQENLEIRILTDSSRV
ncbi:hypothetical protein EV361DRAFT_987853 [Lentinula raphanica]|nr:hypothetical protein EV361DRAFT_987853 [Lentinula raphanica]